MCNDNIVARYKLGYGVRSRVCCGCLDRRPPCPVRLRLVCRNCPAIILHVEACAAEGSPQVSRSGHKQSCVRFSVVVPGESGPPRDASGLGSRLPGGEQPPAVAQWDKAPLRNSPRLYSISMGRRIVSVVFRPASGRVGFGQCCHRPSAKLGSAGRIRRRRRRGRRPGRMGTRRTDPGR